MTGFRCGGDTYYVGRSSDGSCASSNIGSHSQCPCQNGQIHALGSRQTADNRDHGRCKRNIIHKCAGDGGDPQDNGDHQHQIAVTDISDEVRHDFQDTCLLQTTYDHKQSDEEQQRLVINLSDQLQRIFACSDQCHDGDEYTDAGYGQSSLCMGHQQYYCTQEDNSADNKSLFVGNGLGRIRVGLVTACCSCLTGTQFLVEYQIEIQYDHNQGNACDHTGIGQEIREGISQGSTNDDIRGISAHGSGSSQIRTEHFCQNHRHRIEFQQL